jgi:hypothetical protein
MRLEQIPKLQVSADDVACVPLHARATADFRAALSELYGLPEHSFANRAEMKLKLTTAGRIG